MDCEGLVSSVCQGSLKPWQIPAELRVALLQLFLAGESIQSSVGFHSLGLLEEAFPAKS